MRGFLAHVIVWIANFVTLPLSPMRRREVEAIVRDLLRPTVTVNTKKGRLQFNASSHPCHRRARRFHRDEPDTLQWIESMSNGDCYWDVGANVGTYALYAAVGSDIRVLAFEPAASSYAVLNQNIELNGLTDRIQAYCIAFSNETRLDALNMAHTGAGTSMHGFATELDQFGRVIDTKFQQGAVGFCIDDFVRVFSPPPPTHVKIDVDGAELEILRGGRDTFSGPSVRSMLVEIEGDRASPRNRKIMALMIELGFVSSAGAAESPRNVVFHRSSV